MKNGFLFFLGLLAAVGLSWGGIVLGSHAQLGKLAPYYDDNDSNLVLPTRLPGVAARGQIVYRDLGCAECHTQQVRAPNYGSDKDRGWGERQSVPRDYIFQSFPQLGSNRIGPDLANLGGRKPAAPSTEELYSLLYNGHGQMPAYKFLFEDRVVSGEVSARALKLSGASAPAPGHQVVPTERAETLVSYLLSLNNTYDYPEAQPAANEGAKKEGEKAPAAHEPAKKEGEKK